MLSLFTSVFILERAAVRREDQRFRHVHLEIQVSTRNVVELDTAEGKFDRKVLDVAAERDHVVGLDGDETRVGTLTQRETGRQQERRVLRLYSRCGDRAVSRAQSECASEAHPRCEHAGQT